MSTESLSTEQLLRRYVSGALTAPEEAELERRASTDEGLREALFGYRQSPVQDHQARIAAMVHQAKPAAVRRPLIRYAAAATILVLLGIAALLLPRYFNGPEEVAMETPSVESQELPPAGPAEPPTAAPPANTAPAPRRPNEAPTVTSAEPPPSEEEATEAPAAAAELADEVMAENKILPPPAVLRAPILLDEGTDTNTQNRRPENAARQQVDIEPVLSERARARPVEGLESLKARIERDRPAQVPAGRVRVSFLVHPGGSLSDFRFRGRADEATMEYVGTTLVESSVWEIEGASAADGGADVGRPVRVYLKLRFD